MMRPEIEKLLGGYAAGTLTPEERRALFAAALEDQELFDTLAREQALRDLLAEPEARARVLAALGERGPAMAMAWWRRPAVAAMAAGVVVAAVALTVSWPGRKPAPAPQRPVLVAQVKEAPAPAAEPKEVSSVPAPEEKTAAAPRPAPKTPEPAILKLPEAPPAPRTFSFRTDALARRAGDVPPAAGPSVQERIGQAAGSAGTATVGAFSFRADASARTVETGPQAAGSADLPSMRSPFRAGAPARTGGAGPQAAGSTEFPSARAEGTAALNTSPFRAGAPARTGGSGPQPAASTELPPVRIGRAAALMKAGQSGPVLRVTILRTGDGGAWLPVAGAAVQTGEAVRFRVASQAPGRVQLIALDAAGKPRVAGEADARPGAPCDLPADGLRFDTAGRRQFLLRLAGSPPDTSIRILLDVVTRP